MKTEQEHDILIKAAVDYWSKFLIKTPLNTTFLFETDPVAKFLTLQTQLDEARKNQPDPQVEIFREELIKLLKEIVPIKRGLIIMQCDYGPSDILHDAAEAAKISRAWPSSPFPDKDNISINVNQGTVSKGNKVIFSLTIPEKNPASLLDSPSAERSRQDIQKS